MTQIKSNKRNIYKGPENVSVFQLLLLIQCTTQIQSEECIWLTVFIKLLPLMQVSNLNQRKLERMSTNSTMQMPVRPLQCGRNIKFPGVLTLPRFGHVMELSVKITLTDYLIRTRSVTYIPLWCPFPGILLQRDYKLDFVINCTLKYRSERYTEIFIR